MKKIFCVLMICICFFMLCSCKGKGNFSKIHSHLEKEGVNEVLEEREDYRKTLTLDASDYLDKSIQFYLRREMQYFGIIIIHEVYLSWNIDGSCYISITGNKGGNKTETLYFNDITMERYIEEGVIFLGEPYEGMYLSEHKDFVEELLNEADKYFKENYGYGIVK